MATRDNERTNERASGRQRSNRTGVCVGGWVASAAAAAASQRLFCCVVRSLRRPNYAVILCTYTAGKYDAAVFRGTFLEARWQWSVLQVHLHVGMIKACACVWVNRIIGRRRRNGLLTLDAGILLVVEASTYPHLTCSLQLRTPVAVAVAESTELCVMSRHVTSRRGQNSNVGRHSAC